MVGWVYRRAARLAAAVAVAGLAAVIPALPAMAVGVPGSEAFSITPAPDSAGQAPSYFSMTLAAGGVASGIAIISNEGQTTDTLDIDPTVGVTAGNGGSAYADPTRRCSGPGCWVTGLPGAVTLPADTKEQLQFTVHVPAKTAPGQYLAGITVQAASKPLPVPLGSEGGRSLGAVIIRLATVGVAITVGRLSQLTTRLQIPSVSGVALETLSRLDILLDNTGQTFAHGTAKASCVVSGKSLRFTVLASTVLPGGHAVIPVNAGGLPRGTPIPCTVRLSYGHGLVDTWTGLVTVPALPRTRIVHTGPGVYAVIPAGGIPTWAFVLIGLSVLALAAVVVLLLRLRRLRHAG
jgi:WxL interacting protein linking bacterial and host surfaces